MLQKVSIQNFKSLKDVTLELQKVNLLIGPNNSGKSNFLKALELWDIIDDEQIDEVSKWFKSSDVFQKENNNEVVFKLTLEKVSPGKKENQAILGIKYGDFLSGITNKIGLHITNYKFWQDALPNENQQNWVIDTDNSSFPISYYFINFFKNIKLYKPNPTKLITPFPILPNQPLVNNDASNLIAFFDTLRDEYPENFKAIENDLNKCIPELSGLRFENVEIKKDDDLFKIYGDKTFKRLGLFDNVNKITYWADELSEGTLYFLALLCIVHQPNPPKLLLLEEPEKGIHPRRIHEVMKFIFQLAEDKDIQVIMTSHNEHVLEEFTLIPEAVFIFDKDDEGATFVKNLQKDIIEPDTKKAIEFGIEPIDYLDNIGENWFMGLMGGVPA